MQSPTRAAVLRLLCVASLALLGCGDDGSLPPAMTPDGGVAPTEDGGAEPADLALPGLSLSGPERTVIRVGTETAVAIQIERSGGFDSPVEVTIAGLPTGVTAAPITLEGNEGVLALDASAAAATGERVSVELLASGGGLLASTAMELFTVGAPGEQDTGFISSLAALHGNESATFVLANDDGTVLVAGRSNVEPFLRRWRPDGSIDSSYGDGGRVQLETDHHDRACDLRPLPDGRALVYVQEAERARVLAVGGTGAIDPTLDVDSHELCHSRGLLPLDDGRIAIAGSSPRDTVELRLANGAFDPSFGDGGTMALEGPEFQISATESQLITNDGSILAMFRTYVDGEERIGLVRYTMAGELDPTFGTDGIELVGTAGFYPIAIQRESEDSMVLVAFDDPDVVLVWRDGNGEAFAPPRSTTFSVEGTFPNDVAADGAGATLVLSATAGTCYVRRILASGALDPEFGIGGVSAVPVPNGSCSTLGVEPGVRAAVGGWDRESAGEPTRVWVSQLWL